jgi:hypothetical protein
LRNSMCRLFYSWLIVCILMMGVPLGGHVIHADDSVADYITFKYDHFYAGDQWLLINRHAAVNGTHIRLTPALANNGGSVFNREKVSLKDDRSFSTYFTFVISGSVAYNGGPRGGDGIVFTVQTHSNTSSSIGGTLGYTGIKESIAVKFDTWQNSEDHKADKDKDPSDNSIAVMMDGDIDVLLKSVAIDSSTLDLMTGTIHAWIDYNGPEGELEVRVNKGSNTRPDLAALSYTLADNQRLTDILNSDNAYVGFTAATGGSRQNHDITSWYFTNSYSPIDVENNTYTQAPSGYELETEALEDGTVGLSIKALGENTTGVPITVKVDDDKAVVTPSSTTTDSNGEASVILSSSDNSTIVSKVTVEGPGGVNASANVTIAGRTAAPHLANIIANATSKVVTVKGVPEGATVKIYDHEDEVIATKANVTGGEALFEGVSELSIANAIKVTFHLSPQVESERTAVTPKENSAALDAEDVDANVMTDKVTVRDVPKDATIIVYDEDGKEIGRKTNESAEAVQLVLDLDLEAGKDIRVTIIEDGKLESEPLVITITAPTLDISTQAQEDGTLKLSIKLLGEHTTGVPFTVSVDHDKAAVTPTTTTTDSNGEASVILSSSDNSTIVSKVTVEGPGGVNASADVTIAGRTAAPLLANIIANATSKVVTVKGVPEGAIVKIYDHEDELIATKPNITGGEALFEGVSELSIANAIKVTFHLSPQAESERTEVTPKENSAALDEADIEANVTTDEVTVRNVPEGATVIVYDENGDVLGSATNPGPGATEVVLDDLGLEAGKDIQVTITEDGKLESEPTIVTVPAPPPGISTSPSSSDVLDIDIENRSVTVDKVPPGATVIIYDQDGNEIGRGTNNGATTGEVTIIVDTLDHPEIKITIQENDKLESSPVTINIEQHTVEDVEEAIRELEIGFQEEDTWESVTLPLFVVSVGSNNTSVHWTSSKPTVVEITDPVGHKIEALVHRQEKDTSVILSAKVSKNGVERTRTFLVIVKAIGLVKSVEEAQRQVNVTGGDEGQVSKSIDIDRILLTDGSRIIKIDKAIFDVAKANDFVNDPNTVGGVSSIYVDEIANDESDEIAIEIPEASLALLHGNGNSLEIRTDNGTLVIDNSVLGNMKDSFLDLFFRVVPVRDANRQRTINNNILDDVIVTNEAGGRTVSVLGSSLEIETNYTDYATTLFIPFAKNNIIVPAGDASSFLNSLRVYIEHSDETKIVRGTVVNDGGGTPIGLSIVIAKFSTFSIVRLQDRTTGGTQTDIEAKPAIVEEDPIKSAVRPIVSPNYHAAYISGFTDGSFRPNQAVTRAEMAAILGRNMSFSEQYSIEQLFPDVPEAHWAAASIEQLHRVGLFVGDNQGNFLPNNEMTRAELAIIAAKWMKLDIGRSDEHPFPDVASSHWAASAIAAIYAADIIVGYPDGTFRADERVTRAEAITIMNRLLGRQELTGVVNPTWQDVPSSHWAFRHIEEASREHYYLIGSNGMEELVEVDEINELSE